MDSMSKIGKRGFMKTPYFRVSIFLLNMVFPSLIIILSSQTTVSNHYSTVTGIFFLISVFGIFISSTPLLYAALTLLGSTEDGKEIAR